MQLCMCVCFTLFFFFKQKTAYEMRISDWSSDVCSSELIHEAQAVGPKHPDPRRAGLVRERALRRYALLSLLGKPGREHDDVPYLRSDGVIERGIGPGDRKSVG